MPTRLHCLLTTTCIAAVLAAQPSHAQANPPPSAAPTPVRTATATPASNPPEVRAIGRTAPLKQARLYARATGTIAECRVDIGAEVKAEAPLAIIHAPEIAHQIEAAQAKIAQLTARADLAKAQAQRGEPLADARAIPAEELDERRAAERTTTADLRAARAELAKLEETQNFLTIRAPFDGTITARRIDRGDHVNGDSNSPDAWLFQIAQLDELRMVLHVPPESALRIREGQSAELQFPDLPGRAFTAKVARLSGMIDETSGTMRVELALPNPDHTLPAGLSGNARITTPARQAIVTVPANAIVVHNGSSKVAAVRDGKAHFTDVTPGHTLGTNIEILAGLDPGTEVIVSPNALLRDGDPVIPTPAKR